VADKLLEEKSARFTEQNKNQIDGLLNPLRLQLADFRGRIDTVYKTESDDRAALKAQIEQLRLLNSRITDEAHELTMALKGDSQTRGAWGELILERLLEGSGLRPGEDFVAQETVTRSDGSGRIRPDIILRLPDKRHMVIDSKVSLVDYVRFANAADPSERSASLRAHVEAVRGHIKDLAGKQYQDSGELFTPDYVLMFVPIEPAFSAALENDSDLYYWAFDRRVILVTAASLLVALKTVATLWRQDRQSKNVLEIARRGGLLYDKFAGLVEDIEGIGHNLARTRESYDDALAKLKTGRGNLLAQVEELKSLGAKAQKSLPAAEPIAEQQRSKELNPPTVVDTTTREAGN
jgi:DNA recombination protein RmuC